MTKIWNFCNKSIYILLIILLFTACSSKKSSDRYGGTFNFAISNEPKTFLARNVGDFYSATVLNQIYEELVTLNPKTLKVEPCLAMSWAVSKDGKTIKFVLRDDVFFQKNKDISNQLKLSPEDVVFSVELACTPYKGKESYAYSTIYKGVLVGAENFYNGKSDHIKGITVHGNTIIFNLIKRDINFLSKLAQPAAAILSKKIVKDGFESDLVGTGPFRFATYKNEAGNSEIILLRNQHYRGKDKEGNKLPYLDSLVFKVVNGENQQLKMFEKGEIQFIDGLPPDEISTMLGKGKIKDFNGVPPRLILIRRPLLGTEYYFFNLKKKIFQNKKVRKAINYAINRKYLVQNILQNQAFGIGDGGIVPPAVFKGYNEKRVEKHAYTFRPIKAKQLLAEAGYPDGKGFPTISIKYNIGATNYEVANEIAMQLKNVLNIDVNLDGEPFDMLLKDEDYAKGDIYRSAWYADYYSPESFLVLGYGKSIPKDTAAPSKMNSSRYSNSKFDELLDKARETEDLVDRFNYFSQAESVLMEDAPFIILWYDETIKILPSKVRGLHFNASDYYIFKQAYFKKWTKEEWEQRILNKY